jgi:hypothetical protein
MGPKQLELILNELNMMPGLSKTQALEHLKTQRLVNKGVEDLFKSQKDTQSVIGKLMDMSDEGIKSINPMDKFSTVSKVFTQLMDPKFLTEKVAPGIVGGVQALEMGGHLDETFGNKTYEELTKSFERPESYVDPKENNLFQGQTVEKNGPYGISKWKESNSSRRRVVSQSVVDEIKSSMPKYTVNSILSQLSSPEFVKLSQTQKLNTVNKMLTDLQKDLAPIQKKLLEMGVDYTKD